MVLCTQITPEASKGTKSFKWRTNQVVTVAHTSYRFCRECTTYTTPMHDVYPLQTSRALKCTFASTSVLNFAPLLQQRPRARPHPLSCAAICPRIQEAHRSGSAVLSFETWRLSRHQRSTRGVQVSCNLRYTCRVILFNYCFNLLAKCLGVIAARTVTLNAYIFVRASCFLAVCIIMHSRSQFMFLHAYPLYTLMCSLLLGVKFSVYFS